MLKGVEEKKRWRTLKKNKILKNQIKFRSKPAPSTCSRPANFSSPPTAPSVSAHSAASSPPTPIPSPHHHHLLPPLSIPSVSFFLSLYKQTGRDRETVVVLAVWHYQLINPCQQLVPPTPNSNPPSAGAGVEELTDPPLKVWLAKHPSTHAARQTDR